MKNIHSLAPVALGAACLMTMTTSLIGETTGERNSIGRQLEGVDHASTFVTLLKNTDSAKHLLFSTKSNVTVFVPTNKAFEKLSEERRKALFDPANKHWLERVLAYHAVHGSSLDSYVLTRIGLAKNGVGQNLKISGATADDLSVDGFKIIESDFTCSNGIVHFIDDVIDPVELDLFESIEEDGRFTVLSKLLKRSGLTKLLQNRHEKYTLFAPTDKAFESLPDGTIADLMAPENLDLLSDVLRTHIVSGTVTVGKIPGAPFPLGTTGSKVINEFSQELVYRQEHKGQSIDGVNIASYDHLARNGIFHVIDKPLLPKRDTLLASLEKTGDYELFLELVALAGRKDSLDQMRTPITVFAPTDEALRREGIADKMETFTTAEGSELLRGIISRHIIDKRIPLTNAISYQRFTTSFDQRLDVRRDGDERNVQGIPIVETDMIAANGIAHRIDGVISDEMEAVDNDQNWSAIRVFIVETLTEGSKHYTAGNYEAACDYFEARNFEFRVRFAKNLKGIYGVDATSSLTSDTARNRHYEFAMTAWNQRNGFRDLLRDVEKCRSLIIDEQRMRPIRRK